MKDVMMDCVVMCVEDGVDDVCVGVDDDCCFCDVNGCV